MEPFTIDVLFIKINHHQHIGFTCKCLISPPPEYPRIIQSIGQEPKFMNYDKLDTKYLK